MTKNFPGPQRLDSHETPPPKMPMPWRVDLRARCLAHAVEILARMPREAKAEEAIAIAEKFEAFATKEISETE